MEVSGKEKRIKRWLNEDRTPNARFSYEEAQKRGLLKKLRPEMYSQFINQENNLNNEAGEGEDDNSESENDFQSAYTAEDFDQNFNPAYGSEDFQSKNSQNLTEQYQRLLKAQRIEEKVQAGNFQGALGEMAGEKEIGDLNNIDFKNSKSAWNAIKGGRSALKNLKNSDVAKEITQKGGQILTAQILNKAELALVVFPFGTILGFLYINVHWFCRYSHISMELREYFCPFGAEWGGGGKVAAGLGKSTAAKSAVSKPQVATSKSVNSPASSSAETADGSETEETPLDKVNKGLELVELAIFVIVWVILLGILALIVGLFCYIGYMLYLVYGGGMWKDWSSFFTGLKVLWSALGGLE